MHKELIELNKEYLMIITFDSGDHYSRQLYEVTKTRLRQKLDGWDKLWERNMMVKEIDYPNGTRVMYISVDKDINLLAELAMFLI